MSTDFGTDIGTFFGPSGDDLDRNLSLVSGRRAVAEAVARLWQTPKGALITDPEAGLDSTEWLSAGMDQAGAFVLQGGLAAEAQRDERVAACLTLVILGESTKSLSITGEIETNDGETFTLVVGVDGLTVALLTPTA